MKRIKFMLLSLALVAVIGGALAFNVKNSNRFCTTLAQDPGTGYTCIINGAVLKCPNLALASTTNTNQGAFFCTTPEPVGGCNPNLNCLTPTKQIKAGDQ